MTGRRPRQATLFDDADPGGHSASLVSISKGRAPLSKAQRAFNRLIGRIRRLRTELARWTEYDALYQRRLATELASAGRAVCEAQRRFVLRLDALMGLREKGEKLSRRHRERVRAQIEALLDDLDGEGDDAELDALREKYFGMSRQERKREELEAVEILLGGMFGDDVVEGHDAADVDELLRFADERLGEREQAAARERERRAESRRGNKRATRAELAAQPKKQARRDALQSVREIYRRLASALHPDREAEAGERERKTQLMQRVNQAYERNDLLELLALQIEIEQIDPEQLAETPEQRVIHYNAVLREQQRTLETELEQRLGPFRMALGRFDRKLTPDDVDRSLSAEIERIHALRRRIERDLQRLEDPRSRRAVLDEMPDPAMDVDDDEALDPLMLDALFGQVPQPQRRSKRKRKKKKNTGGRRRR